MTSFPRMIYFYRSFDLCVLLSSILITVLILQTIMCVVYILRLQTLETLIICFADFRVDDDSQRVQFLANR